MLEKIELLSPAGNIKCFQAALKSGADAIYMGINNFNARKMAENFTLEEYKKCILMAHILNVKVYLTLNTLVLDNEINDALKLVLELYNVGLDAIIIQDIGLAMKIHEIIPELSLHASTQMSVYSLEQVNFLKSIGFKRVVLARELTFDEIKYIKENTDIELEVFVHGALCVSFSGQCLMSKMIGDRSANRGSCAQPCRKKYSIVDINKNVLAGPNYILSKKDTYGLDYINKLKQIGITSLKIEGRNRTPEYVYTVTSIYRKYLNNSSTIVELKDIKKIMQVFNRSGLCKNYLDGLKKEESISYKTPKNTGLFLGKVISLKKEYIKLKLEEYIDLHDGIEIYSKNGKIISTIVTCIRDDDYNIINKKVESGNYVFLGDIKEKVSIGDIIYKTSNSRLNSETLRIIEDNSSYKKNEVYVSIFASLNSYVKLVANINGKSIEVVSKDICELSQNKALSKKDFEDNFSKNYDSLFILKIDKFCVDEDLFFKVSSLNNLRKELIKKLEEAFAIDRNLDIDKILHNLNNFDNNEATTICSNTNSLFIYSFDLYKDYIKYYEKFEDKNNISRIYINILYGYSNVDRIKDVIDKYKDLEIYLYIPNVVLKNGERYILENIEKIIKFGIKGFLLSSYHFFDLVKSFKEKYNLKIVADYKLNISNSLSCKFIKHIGFDELMPSVETDEKTLINMSKIIKLEVLKNNITVMTTRYCVLSSFLRDKTLDKCSMPCLKEKYKLMDEKNYTYDIYSSNIDCISEYVRHYKLNYSNEIVDKLSIRYAI